MTVPGATPPPEPLAKGERRVGPYEIRARIGAGRRTSVYLGARDGDGASYLVRELAPGVDPKIFDAELRLAARAFPSGSSLKGVTIRPGGSFAHGIPIVGESLATILHHAMANRSPIGLEVALAIAMGISSRLARAGEPFVHGDLVPHHVLVGYDGSVHLIDAAGAAFRERLSASSRQGYRSPEHVRGGSLVPASDIFVLGILLFEMTTSTRLYGTADRPQLDAAIADGKHPRPRDVVGDGYPLELQLILRKMLRPSPAGRFSDGTSARDALRLVVGARREVGQADLAAWLEGVFPDRHATWASLIGDTGLLEPTTAVTERSEIPNFFRGPPLMPLSDDASDATPTPLVELAPLQDSPAHSISSDLDLPINPRPKPTGSAAPSPPPLPSPSAVPSPSALPSPSLPPTSPPRDLTSDLLEAEPEKKSIPASRLETLIIRDRTGPSAPPAPTPAVSRRAPLRSIPAREANRREPENDRAYHRLPPPTPIEAQSRNAAFASISVTASEPERPSSSALVIPLSDAELARARRSRRRLVLLVFLALALLALLLDTNLREPQKDAPQRIKSRPLPKVAPISGAASVPGSVVRSVSAPVTAVPPSVVASVMTSSLARLAVTTTRSTRPVPIAQDGQRDPRPTFVQIRVFPKTSRVEADGVIQNPSAAIEVADRPVRIRVTAPGYQRFETILEIGHTAPLEVLLRRDETGARKPR